MTITLLFTFLTCPTCQQSASDSYCASLPLQRAERLTICNPVKAERIADVSRFLREVEADRTASLMATVLPFAMDDGSNPFAE